MGVSIPILFASLLASGLVGFTTAEKSVVNLYNGPGCAFPATAFIGTCEANCFQFGFDSVWTVAGTDDLVCITYKDDNCLLLETPNDKGAASSGSGKCAETPGGKSLKCFSGC
ncbi:hypothetical protein LTR09_007128 [Extremus antarcticus]|uniref:Uncharacterized protein n=1 Tax=Extremus antarcticus TaxID=702011 RepID=A0AAJ0GBB0_9PEZI|nr:hypothetical protein LTR09_007128 [Extremus antarcticus]